MNVVLPSVPFMCISRTYCSTRELELDSLPLTLLDELDRLDVLFPAVELLEDDLLEVERFNVLDELLDELLELEGIIMDEVLFAAVELLDELDLLDVDFCAVELDELELLDVDFCAVELDELELDSELALDGLDVDFCAVELDELDLLDVDFCAVELDELELEDEGLDMDVKLDRLVVLLELEDELLDSEERLVPDERELELDWLDGLEMEVVEASEE